MGLNIHHTYPLQQSGKAPVLAAIDLGTNSCRLLIARVDNSGMKIVDSFSRVVRLGEGIHKTGLLTNAAIERTIEALRICQTKIEDNQAQKVRAVTTEACRRARNSDVLLKRVEKEVHIRLELISSAEEARLALTGCAAMLNPELPYALTFDIGGGSTEVMWLKIQPGFHHRTTRKQFPAPMVLDWISLPFGVVTTSEEFAGRHLTANDFKSVVDRVFRYLQPFAERNRIADYMKANQVQMVGTSGTVTTLAAIQLNLQRYDRRVIDGMVLQTDTLQGVIQNILGMSYENRVAHPCIGHGRADLVIIGSAILEGIYRSFPIDSLRVADRGVREGILIELMNATLKEQEDATHAR